MSSNNYVVETARQTARRLCVRIVNDEVFAQFINFRIAERKAYAKRDGYNSTPKESWYVDSVRRYDRQFNAKAYYKSARYEHEDL